MSFLFYYIKLINGKRMPVEYTKNAEGLFVCSHDGCNKTFARQNTMYYHIKRHLNQFSYKCTECDKGFIQKSAFLHHMAAVHPGNDTVSIGISDVKPSKKEQSQRQCDDPVIITETESNNNIVDNRTDIKPAVDIKIKNPYDGQSFACPCCDHKTKTKANALVHYARLHAKDWIPTYNKDAGCTHCKKQFSSIAAYLYHCTGCVPANKTHRDAVSRIMESA